MEMKQFHTKWHRSCLVGHSVRKDRLFLLVTIQTKKNVTSARIYFNAWKFSTVGFEVIVSLITGGCFAKLTKAYWQ